MSFSNHQNSVKSLPKFREMAFHIIFPGKHALNLFENSCRGPSDMMWTLNLGPSDITLSHWYWLHIHRNVAFKKRFKMFYMCWCNVITHWIIECVLFVATSFVLPAEANEYVKESPAHMWVNVSSFEELPFAKAVLSICRSSWRHCGDIASNIASITSMATNNI
jgi:hypothetical protein